MWYVWVIICQKCFFLIYLVFEMVPHCLGQMFSVCVCVCVCTCACARMCVSRYTLCAFDSLLLQHIVGGLQVEACNCRVSRPLTRCQPDYTSWHVLCNNPFTFSLACSTFALTVKNYLTEKGRFFVFRHSETFNLTQPEQSKFNSC